MKKTILSVLCILTASLFLSGGVFCASAVRAEEAKSEEELVALVLPGASSLKKQSLKSKYKTYEELGGFVYPLKTNEDMFFAARAIRSGYRVAYAAEARVLHSHNFSLKEQYERNRIQGYEIERHRPLLGNVSKVSEGFRLARFVSGGLLKQGRVLSFARFGLDCFARLFGSRAGRQQFLGENQQA